MLGIIILPLSAMVTCKETHAVIIALHKKGFTGKDNAASKIQGERFNCCEEGFRAPKKVQKEPGLKLIQLLDRGTTSTELGQECHFLQVGACSHLQ